MRSWDEAVISLRLGSIVSLNGLLKTEYSLILEGFFILPANVHVGGIAPL